ncbi:MAG: hypothetical protein K0R90_1839, partial [Oscillospiraceae bacterium]|nr:hypothetical protein [Oscillospiraceae bacterium]
KDGLKFSDNSSVSAGDVVYSANQAKSSKLYSKRLQNVSSVSQDGNKKIVFSLKREDQKFANCLDFPVVKNNTAQYKGGHPTGSGRYKLSGTSGSPSLVYNILWNPNKKPKFSKIPLVTTPAEEAIITSVKTGSVAMMFSDLSDGEIGGIGATTEPVNLNNLVYLGINANKGVLKDAEFRQAISYAIDQNTVLSKGFVGRGVATYLPYNPLMNIGEELSDKYFIGYSETKANKLLDELGYEKRNAGGIRLDKNKPIELNLLINKQNNYKKMTATGLQAMLKEVGIGVNIISEDKFSSFTSKVNQKKFDLYLGETKLLNNMDITEFFTSSALSVGITKKSTLLEAYKKYQNKSEKYSYFAKEFSEQAPFVPLLFRSGIVAYNNNIKTDIISTPSDIFYNITDWK